MEQAQVSKADESHQRALSSIAQFVAQLSDPDTLNEESLICCLDDIYQRLSDVGEESWLIARETELLDHLMRILFPRFSDSVFYHTLVIFSDILLDFYEALHLGIDCGLMHLLGDVLVAGEYSSEIVTPILYTTGRFLGESSEFRSFFLENNLVDRILSKIAEFELSPDFELCFLFQNLFLQGVDDHLANISIPYLLNCLSLESSEVQRCALSALSEAFKFFPPFRDSFRGSEWIPTILGLAETSGLDPSVRINALKLVRHCCDYEPGRTTEFISIDFLNAIATLIESERSVAESGFVAISQLILNSEAIMNERIFQSQMVPVAISLLDEGPFGGAAAASLLLVSIMRDSREEIAIPVFESAFEKTVRFVLETEHDEWKIEVIDGLAVLLGHLENWGKDELLRQIVDCGWLRELLAEIRTGTSAAVLLNVVAFLDSHYFHKCDE
jgi:hypothetical protein